MSKKLNQLDISTEESQALKWANANLPIEMFEPTGNQRYVDPLNEIQRMLFLKEILDRGITLGWNIQMNPLEELWRTIQYAAHIMKFYLQNEIEGFLKLERPPNKDLKFLDLEPGNELGNSKTIRVGRSQRKLPMDMAFMYIEAIDFILILTSEMKRSMDTLEQMVQAGARFQETALMFFKSLEHKLRAWARGNHEYIFPPRQRFLILCQERRNFYNIFLRTNKTWILETCKQASNILKHEANRLRNEKARKARVSRTKRSPDFASGKDAEVRDLSPRFNRRQSHNEAPSPSNSSETKPDFLSSLVINFGNFLQNQISRKEKTNVPSHRKPTRSR